MLDAFNIQEDFASFEEIEQVRWKSKKGLKKIFYQIYQKLLPKKYCRTITEATLMPFDPYIIQRPLPFYLRGYWQTEKYFIDIQDRDFEKNLHYDMKCVKSREIGLI